MEDLDYSLLPEVAWTKLSSWYGLADGSRPIGRKVIEWGMYVKHLKVEVYPIRLELGCHPLDQNKKVYKTFSRIEKMSQVKEAAKEVFEISEDKECRLWHRYMTSHYEQVKGQLLSDATTVIVLHTCCLATTLIITATYICMLL